MASQTVRLHGGPMHGRTIALPAGDNHFHVTQPDERDLVSFTEEQDIRQIETIPLREGTYSRVTGFPTDFEWDGWVTH